MPEEDALRQENFLQLGSHGINCKVYVLLESNAAGKLQTFLSLVTANHQASLPYIISYFAGGKEKACGRQRFLLGLLSSCGRILP